MKKTYEQPQLEVKKFGNNDVISTSDPVKQIPEDWKALK